MDPRPPAPTPTQRRAFVDLLGAGRPRPAFDPDLAAGLRAALEAGLAPVAARRSDDRPLVLTKRALSQIHTCEGLWAASRSGGFRWSGAAAAGTVAHKAVELSLFLRPAPGAPDLVDLAIGRLLDASSGGIRTWLLDAPADELAEVRASATDWVLKFQDTFPAPRRSWRPRVESKLALELCGGSVVLIGRVDLALGRADGDVARVLMVDFKTGRTSPAHRDDLRFYALLETIRAGVPPFRVASFYLDRGAWEAQDIDESVLMAAARRVVGGAERLVNVAGGSVPELRPGPACGWCAGRQHCPLASASALTAATGESVG